MSKKILLSILVIVVAVGLVGAGTYAWWSDEAISSGNTFETGDLELTVTGGPINITNMCPNASAEYKFNAKNDGSIDGSELLMTGKFEDVAPGTLSSVLYVTSVTVDGTDVLGGTVALSAFGGGDLDLGALAAGDDVDVVITIWMDDDATGNMNESVTGDVSFTLNQ